MAPIASNAEIQTRLHHFWSVTIFGLGILWGFSNLVYIPIVVLTSVHGGSLAEVYLIVCGGLLIFLASIRAFYNRRAASILLFGGGCLLLVLALALPHIPAAQTSGAANRLLTLSSGGVALLLGIFGAITESRAWPILRTAAK